MTNKWSKEEDETLLKAITDCETINEACIAASQLLNRTPKACAARWYNTLIKKYGDKTAITFMCFDPTYIPSVKEKPKKSLWQKVLDIFRK